VLRISAGESRPRKKKLFSSLVMFVENTNYSHNFISWKDNYNQRWVAELKGSGIKILSNIEFKKTSEIINIYTYECLEFEYEKGIRYIWKMSSLKYNILQIIGLAEMRILNYLARKFKIKSRKTNRFRDGEFSQICCEFMINTIKTAKGYTPKSDVESMGLKECQEYNLRYGKKTDKETIDRINGKV